jgi:hypothetical protein
MARAGPVTTLSNMIYHFCKILVCDLQEHGTWQELVQVETERASAETEHAIPPAAARGSARHFRSFGSLILQDPVHDQTAMHGTAGSSQPMRRDATWEAR